MDVYQWRVRKSFATEDAVISGSPLWLLETVSPTPSSAGGTRSRRGSTGFGRGTRADQAPRSEASAEPKAAPPPLPAARTFTPGEHTADDVAAFAAELLKAGFSMTVRPKR